MDTGLNTIEFYSSDISGNFATSINSSDIGQPKSQSGIPVTGSNFRQDVNIDGDLNSGDIGSVKSKSGTDLP